jgi:hypothetical protein
VSGGGRKVVFAALALTVSCGIFHADPTGSVSAPLVSWTTPAWFIDPSNRSGTANDTNDCTTATTPCRTYAEVARRWATTSPVLGQDTTITFLSSHVDDSDPVYLTPVLEDGAALVVQGAFGSDQRVTTGAPTGLVALSGTGGHTTTLTMAGGSRWGMSSSTRRTRAPLGIPRIPRR